MDDVELKAVDRTLNAGSDKENCSPDISKPAKRCPRSSAVSYPKLPQLSPRKQRSTVWPTNTDLPAIPPRKSSLGLVPPPLTFANVGIRRNNAPTLLLSTPPRSSYSQKMSSIFADARNERSASPKRRWLGTPKRPALKREDALSHAPNGMRDPPDVKACQGESGSESENPLNDLERAAELIPTSPRRSAKKSAKKRAPMPAGLGSELENNFNALEEVIHLDRSQDLVSNDDVTDGFTRQKTASSRVRQDLAGLDTPPRVKRTKTQEYQVSTPAYNFSPDEEPTFTAPDLAGPHDKTLCHLNELDEWSTALDLNQQVSSSEEWTGDDEFLPRQKSSGVQCHGSTVPVSTWKTMESSDCLLNPLDFWSNRASNESVKSGDRDNSEPAHSRMDWEPEQYPELRDSPSPLKTHHGISELNRLRVANDPIRSPYSTGRPPASRFRSPVAMKPVHISNGPTYSPETQYNPWADWTPAASTAHMADDMDLGPIIPALSPMRARHPRDIRLPRSPANVGVKLQSRPREPSPTPSPLLWRKGSPARQSDEMMSCTPRPASCDGSSDADDEDNVDGEAVSPLSPNVEVARGKRRAKGKA